jgi:hypothetical protein
MRLVGRYLNASMRPNRMELHEAELRSLKDVEHMVRLQRARELLERV